MEKSQISSWIKPPNVYTGPAAFMQTKIRQSDLVGLFFDIIGVILIILGGIDLLKII